MKKITYLLLFLGCLSSTYGQNNPSKKKPTFFGKVVSSTHTDDNGKIVRCASTEYEEYLKIVDPKRADKQEFEAWLAPKVEQIKKAMQASETNRQPNVVYNIPVVVHVVHTGTAVGVGANIADAQVISQITVLNQDFRKMIGTPGFNTNAVGADTEIQFCLAQRTPTGQPTTGINRITRTQTTWTPSQIESTLKPSTQWDPTKYLNIWVVTQMTEPGIGEILGFAQFPTNSGLSGLGGGTTTANTDGVVIGYRYFGSRTLYPSGSYSSPYDRGRTTTHEVGHFFGLRHINGDSSSCTVDATDSFNDYCLDTPAQARLSTGCPSGQDSCPSSPGVDMYQNYMDYSNDTCLNIFTQNQKARIVAVMQNSPRRASLASSNACTPPTLYGLDGSVEITNLNISCGNSFTPTLTLVNRGTTTLTSASFSYRIDNGTSQTFNWTGSLVTNASQVINVGTLTSTPGEHTFYTVVNTVNGVADQNPENDNSSAFTLVQSFDTTEYVFTLQPDYFGTETTWTLTNSAGAFIDFGGPYSLGQASGNTIIALPAIVNKTWNLSSNECYTFTINDSEDDGICCDYGNGYYNITTVSGQSVASGGTFAANESKTFGVNVLSNSEFNLFEGTKLYPNPSNGIVNISVPTSVGLPENITIYNSLGQVIQSNKVSSQNDLTINAASFSNGIYFIKISKENNNKTLRFIKN